MRSLLPQQVNNICEVGVAYGDFSEFLINEFSPNLFAALDIFNMHKEEMAWGRPTCETLLGKTHRSFYEDRISGKVKNLIITEGLSNDTLNQFCDGFFDLIYVDAAHHYDAVKKDGELSIRKINNGGIIVFNDYTMYDPSLQVPYGVVAAVNELVIENDLRVVGMSLQSHMFCDIAVIPAC